MADARAQIHGLTGIRFFAALHVVIFHCTGWTSSDHSSFVGLPAPVSSRFQ
jgi:peptidoglycan/LPS O-acetylase OafA/YrhL